MGIHYDYKSTRGEKAMKKEAKRKARIEERRARRMNQNKNSEPKSSSVSVTSLKVKFAVLPNKFLILLAMPA